MNLGGRYELSTPHPGRYNPGKDRSLGGSHSLSGGFGEEQHVASTGIQTPNRPPRSPSPYTDSAIPGHQ
jgi:hypothetical protein